MKTTVIGLGLIGGSFAIDLRESGLASVIYGIDSNPKHEQKAIDLGLIDFAGVVGRDISDADFIVLAIPVNALSLLLPSVLDQINPTAVVLDLGSTKGQICRSVLHHPKRSQFVAAHPIAGTENSGPEAAFSGLFRNKTIIICEKEKSSEMALNVAIKVFDKLEMNTIYMEAEEHDKHVAYVSHLSHVSSFLLGQTVLDIEKDEKNIFALAGSGFASTVRLAKSSPEMWAPIFEQNQEYLSQALQEYIEHLQRFQACLTDGNTGQLLEMMQSANEIRRVLEGIELKTKPKSGPPVFEIIKNQTAIHSIIN